MKSWLLCALICVILLCPQGQCAERHGLVETALGNVATGAGEMPMKTLAEALTRYPRAPQFKVSFETIVGSTSAWTSVRYNRQRHTLHLYVAGGSDAGPIKKYCVFTCVSDSILRRMSTRFRNTGGGNVYGLFDVLSQHDCPRQSLPFPGEPLWQRSEREQERLLWLEERERNRRNRL